MEWMRQEIIMKKIILTALAASTALIATSASAQSASGSVSVTGSVAPKCTASPAITGSITLNELAVANGTVNSTFSAQTGGLSRSFTVRCTSPNPGLSVDATALTTTASGATGYTGTVHYTATLTAQKAAGGADASVADTSNVAGATTTSVGSQLANANNNVTVTVSNGNTTNATDLLDSGSYAGSIAIIVSPS
jgi:hypothetical protein